MEFLSGVEEHTAQFCGGVQLLAAWFHVFHLFIFSAACANRILHDNMYASFAVILRDRAGLLAQAKYIRAAVLSYLSMIPGSDCSLFQATNWKECCICSKRQAVQSAIREERARCASGASGISGTCGIWQK